jgi:hypothetical protein
MNAALRERSSVIPLYLSPAFLPLRLFSRQSDGFFLQTTQSELK